MAIDGGRYSSAARAVRRAAHGQEALGVARPISVLGLVRSRGPLPIMLRVADREGRLIWHGPDSFTLLERPSSIKAPAAGRGGPALRLLRLLDRHWDMVIFAGPPLLGLLISVAVAILIRPVPAGLIWLPAAVVGYVAVLMLAQVLNELAWLRRVLGRRVPTVEEVAAESYPGWQWSIRLAHHTRPTPGDQLLRETAQRMEDLVRREAGHEAALRGAETERLLVREVLVALIRGATTDAFRQTIRSSLTQPFPGGSRVALRLPGGPVRSYREPQPAGGGFFFVWLGGVAVVLAVTALLVAQWESADCPQLTCPGRPESYFDAVQWLAWRLLLQDAPGLTPGTSRTTVLGWLFSLVGIMTIPVAWVSVRLAVARTRKAMEVFDELRTPLSNARLLLITVTDTERDAVLAAFRAQTGEVPVRSFAGNVVIYELGAIGRTTVAMVQCARQSGGGPGGSQAVATDAIERWRPDVVIMVGICCGLREDWTPPHQLADVIVATSIYDLDHKIQYEDGVDHQGDRVSMHLSVVNRMQAAATDFPSAKVHLGLLLSSRTLVDSRRHRDQLKADHSRALAYEMEAQGLYAAAATAQVPFTVVKAISDWGVDRDTYYEPAEAARNSASFVVHAISLGAFEKRSETV